MNLSKVLKQKRDAEERLRQRSPQVVFNENANGELSFNSTDSFLKPKNIIAGENITLDVDGKNITINSIGGGTISGESWTPADTPAANGIYDEEMEDALDSSWVWQASSGISTEDNLFTNWTDINPTVPRYSINKISGNLIMQPMSNNKLKVYRAFPFGSGIRWIVGAKVRLLGSNGTDDRVTLAVEKDIPTASKDEPTNGVLVQLRRDGASSSIRTYAYNGGASSVNSSATGSSLSVYTAYLAISQKSDNKITVWISLDGVGWARLYDNESSMNVNGNVGYVYLAIQNANTNSTPCIGVVDWIRFRTGTNDPLDLFLS